TNNSLMGVGAFAEAPKETAAYRRGYLCGMIRGEGSIGHYTYEKADSRPFTKHGFRLALVDNEALARTKAYLEQAGITCLEYPFARESATRQRMMAIRCQRRDEVWSIETAIRWPQPPGVDWRKGFLAGIFDAEGSCSQGVFRISNTDAEIISWIMSSLDQFGFSYTLEHPDRGNGMAVVRLLGGLREKLRFFLLTDPAITRKRSIDGVALKSDADLRVTAIEPLGLDLPMFDITTGTGDFIANGVVSHNCFARNTHTYLDLDAGADFNSRVVVKVNAPELLRRKLASPSWRGEHIAMGTNVDCYQRAEGKYRLMPGIIGALRDRGNPFSILTKGTLILRDIDVLASAAEVTSVGLAVSVGSTDETLWRAVEPGTPSPLRRLEACAALGDRGLGCSVLMGPVIPYLSDSPAQLEATVREIAAAGATSVTPIVLHLRPGAREWFLAWLRETHPDLVDRYARLYRRGSYAPKAYQAEISARVRDLARHYGIGRHSGTVRAGGVSPAPPAPAPPAPAYEQMPLL
ncbi:MAG TPA: LAGLIDADG family homing endonuclease, partial [Streptosporangiaceae bacterium]|nr:LAGLIDADG family homing endonuclease [Streptosporangiaceae bacterium]